MCAQPSNIKTHLHFAWEGCFILQSPAGKSEFATDETILVFFTNLLILFKQPRIFSLIFTFILAYSRCGCRLYYHSWQTNYSNIYITGLFSYYEYIASYPNKIYEWKNNLLKTVLGMLLRSLLKVMLVNIYFNIYLLLLY